MRRFKVNFSKNFWIILSAGAFIIALAFLGTGYLNQSREQARLNDEMVLLDKRIEVLALDTLAAQEAELGNQLAVVEAQTLKAKTQLNAHIVAADVTDALYELAEKTQNQILSIGSAGTATATVNKVPGAVLPLNVTLRGGDADSLYLFVAQLNQQFSTASVKSVQMSIPAGDTEPVAIITLNIFTYNGG